MLTKKTVSLPHRQINWRAINYSAARGTETILQTTIRSLLFHRPLSHSFDIFGLARLVRAIAYTCESGTTIEAKPKAQSMPSPEQRVKEKKDTHQEPTTLRRRYKSLKEPASQPPAAAKSQTRPVEDDQGSFQHWAKRILHVEHAGGKSHRVLWGSSESDSWGAWLANKCTGFADWLTSSHDPVMHMGEKHVDIGGWDIADHVSRVAMFGSCCHTAIHLPFEAFRTAMQFGALSSHTLALIGTRTLPYATPRLLDALLNVISAHVNPEEHEWVRPWVEAAVMATEELLPHIYHDGNGITYEFACFREPAKSTTVKQGSMSETLRETDGQKELELCFKSADGAEKCVVLRPVGDDQIQICGSDTGFVSQIEMLFGSTCVEPEGPCTSEEAEALTCHTGKFKASRALAFPQTSEDLVHVAHTAKTSQIITLEDHYFVKGNAPNLSAAQLVIVLDAHNEPIEAKRVEDLINELIESSDQPTTILREGVDPKISPRFCSESFPKATACRGWEPTDANRYGHGDFSDSISDIQKRFVEPILRRNAVLIKSAQACIQSGHRCVAFLGAAHAIYFPEFRTQLAETGISYAIVSPKHIGPFVEDSEEGLRVLHRMTTVTTDDSDLLELTKQYPTNTLFHFMLADLYVSQKQFEKADIYLEKGLKLFPDSIMAKMIQFRKAIKLQQLEEAKQIRDSIASLWLKKASRMRNSHLGKMLDELEARTIPIFGDKGEPLKRLRKWLA